MTDKTKKIVKNVIGWGIPFGLLILAVWEGIRAVGKISFDAGFKNVNLQDLKNAFINGSGSVINLTLLIKIINGNAFPLWFSNLYFELYHEKVLIAKSSNVLGNFIKQLVPKKGELQFPYDVEVILNNQLLDLVDIFTGKKITFQYKIRGILFGVIPIPFKERSFDYQF